MLTALSIAVVTLLLFVAVLGAWVFSLRSHDREHLVELASLRGATERIAADVVALSRGDRRGLLAEQVNAVPAALARGAEIDAGSLSQGASGLPAAPVETMKMMHEGPLEAPPPGRPVRRDAADLLVRSLAGGDRGPRDASPGAAIIWGAQEELALVAAMLLGIDTKVREAGPEPQTLGSVLTALSDRILAGLELLSQEGGDPAPSPSPVADEDDEPPPSSDSSGPLTH